MQKERTRENRDYRKYLRWGRERERERERDRERETEREGESQRREEKLSQ